jgi:CBS domain containing-hemolysin-like protein
MNCLSADATLEEALQVVISSGHSRIPVYRDTSDNIVGILYVKDLLGLLARADGPRSLPSAYVRPATYIPESKRVDDLLTDMRRMKIHMAVVMDEYGGTAGLVTIEDILEEIVGDIQDEFDTEEDLPVKHQEDGSILVDGRLPIYEVNDLLGADLPTEDFDTIGGFVVGQLGRAPVRGEEVRFDTLRLIADAVEARRLVRVQIIRESAT